MNGPSAMNLSAALSALVLVTTMIPPMTSVCLVRIGVMAELTDVHQGANGAMIL